MKLFQCPGNEHYLQSLAQCAKVFNSISSHVSLCNFLSIALCYDVFTHSTLCSLSLLSQSLINIQ